jgi:hypothetical protein
MRNSFGVRFSSTKSRVVVGLVLMCLAAACGSESEYLATTVTPRESDVSAGQVSRGPFHSILAVDGAVARAPAVTLSLPTGNRWIVVDGATVDAGQPIATVAGHDGSDVLVAARADQDAQRNLSHLLAQARAQPSAIDPYDVQTARISAQRAAADLASAVSGSSGEVTPAPVGGTIRTSSSSAVIQPSTWQFISSLTPVQRFRLGAGSEDALVRIAVPFGAFRHNCTDVRDQNSADESASSADTSAAPLSGSSSGEVTAAENVVCDLGEVAGMTVGLSGVLAITTVSLQNALIVPVAAVTLQAGSLSDGTVTTRRSPGGKTVPVHLLGINGTTVAVDGDLSAGDDLVVAPQSN